MRIIPAPIGIMCLVGGLALAAPALAQQGLYDGIRMTIDQETAKYSVNDEVSDFAIAVLTSQGETVSATQAEAALRLPAATVCRSEDAESSDEGGDDDNAPNTDDDRSTCIDMIQRLRAIMAREERVQALGHDLQAVAGSAELAADAYPGMGTESLLFSEAIRTIWGTEQSGSSATIEVRTWPKNDSTIKEDLNTITKEIGSLQRPEAIGAVWRVLYGTRFARGERGGLNDADTASYPDNAPGTERQYLWKEHDSLDEALLKLRQDLLGDDLPADDDASSSSAGPRRVILYPPKVLMENLVIWVSSDDVGLRQKVPLFPVQPSLIGQNGAILGGNWPPAPPGPTKASMSQSDEDDSRGLCLDPIAEDGFLCRSLSDGESLCEEPAEAQAETIVLAQCEGKEEEAQRTPAGPMICNDLEWRAGDFDPDYQCQPELECADVCNDSSGTPNSNVEFQVFKKEDQDDKLAVSRACVKNDSKILPAYQVLQAAAGLRLTCELENDVDPIDTLPPEEQEAFCCDQVSQTAAVMCRAMEEDGVFAEDDGSRAISESGEPFTPGNCALAFATDACGLECGGPLKEGYLDELIDRANENPADLPETCDEALGQQRVQDLLFEAEDIDEACSPDRTIALDNTILANACYAGRCLEYTLKVHNTTPAFGAFTATDAIVPYGPEVGDRTAPDEAIDLSPIPPDQLPRYVPGEIIGDFDRAFCQLNGLPPLTPTVVCSVDPLRRLALPLIDPFNHQSTLDQQRQELAAEQQSFLRVGLPAGVRIGDDLFIEMLRGPVQALTDSLSVSTELLTQLNDADFTRELCPLSPPQGLTSSSSDTSSAASI